MRRLVGIGLLALLPLAGCTSSSAPRAVSASVPVTRTIATLPFPAPRAGSLPTTLTQRLRAAVIAAANPALANTVPGVTAAVVTPSGSWSYATGRDGAGARLQPDDEMAIGSISKTFTAAEVLRLAVAKKIDLDAPLSRYVDSSQLVDHPTVRQALGMLSGITDGPQTDNWYLRLLERAKQDENAHVSVAASVRVSPGRPSTPGKQQVYSNVNFLLLAEAIQHVTRQPLATLLHADLIRPAGLDRVAVQDTERPAAPIAYPLDGGNDAAPLRDGYLPDRVMASSALGCGSLAADAPTIARWGYELYGARLLPVATVEAMTTPQLSRTFGYGIGYGLGTVVYNKTLGAARGALVGHDGLITREAPDATEAGYRTFLVVDLTHRFSLTVFVPSAGHARQETALVARLVTILQ